MTINYTTLLGLAEPVTGTESGTWGDDVNKGITEYVDIAVAGTQTISGSQTAVTLSITNGSSAGNNIAQVGSAATGSAQYQVINCTGNPASLLTITAPASSKTYIIINATSTSQSVKIVGTGPTTGVTVASGKAALVAWNGSDFRLVATDDITKLTGVLAVANGGTGASSASITAFNNITGYTATGATGTTSTNLVFSTSPTLTTPNLGTPSAATLTNATGLPLTTGVTGTLPVANGGTGLTSITANNVMLGNGTSAVQVVAPGTSGNVLTSNGTTWSSTAPAAGVSLSANNTWTGTQTFNGSSSIFGTVMLDAAETVNVVGAAPSATTNLYVQSGSVQYYTSNAANNFVVNLAFSSGTTMNTALSTNQSVTAALVTTQSSTAYYATSIQVDGTTTGVTTKWIGGAPTAGNASGLDVYRFAVIKTGSATYTVLASLTQYK